MSVKSSSTRYGSVAILIHWTSAAGVILAFIAGFVVANVSPQPGALVAHVVLGIGVLLLTLLRILWWWLADDRPPLPADQPRWQKAAAHAVHFALYVVLIVMAASGITTMLLSGAMPVILAGGPIPDFSEIAPRLAHGALSKLLLVLLVVHVGAALYHQLIRRDGLMARMGAGRG